jgi:hypothetical protein
MSLQTFLMQQYFRPPAQASSPAEQAAITGLASAAVHARVSPVGVWMRAAHGCVLNPKVSAIRGTLLSA